MKMNMGVDPKSIIEQARREHLNNMEKDEEIENPLYTIFSANKTLGSLMIAEDLVEKYKVKTIGERLREIYIHKNGVFVLGENILRNEMQNILKELATKHHKNEIIGKIQDLTITDRKEFNVDKNLINFNNGILDISTNKFIEHDPKYLFFSKIPVDYIPDKDCPNIKNFLADILNKNDLPIIQEWFGYVLYRSYFIKKATIFVGDGNTGKTTLIRLFEKFIGKEGVSGVSLQRIASDKFAAAHFYNKHINIYDDLSFKDINDNGAFKIATGGGSITGEFKYGNQFQFENYAKLTFACNKIPNVNDTNDDAYFNRWIVIQFNNVISPEKIDNFIIEKLTTSEELSGLLNFALEGLRRLLKNGKFSYEKEPDEIKIEMLRSGSSIANFAYDCTEKGGADDWVSKDDLYEAYAQYANSQKLTVLTKTKFGRDLPKYANYATDSKKEGATGWRNIKTKPTDENL